MLINSGVWRILAVWCDVFAALVFPRTLLAQPTGMCEGCPGMTGGMGVMMWIGMIVAWLLAIAAIAALGALTVYLIRRSRL